MKKKVDPDASQEETLRELSPEEQEMFRPFSGDVIGVSVLQHAAWQEYQQMVNCQWIQMVNGQPGIQDGVDHDHL